MTLQLISFNLCPYVQRSVITLEEKKVTYEVKYIDLSNKPQWFLKISPFGKVPLLKVQDKVLFESAVINEFIDETTAGSLHPADPLTKAYNRSWIEFASVMGGAAFRLMMSDSKENALVHARAVAEQLSQMESQIVGPYWNGSDFSLVDAAFAPMLQRIQWCMNIAPELAVFANAPKSRAYCETLLSRPSVQKSVPADIEEIAHAYLADKDAAGGDTPPVWLHARRTGG